jgi:hypothetical protein
MQMVVKEIVRRDPSITEEQGLLQKSKALEANKMRRIEVF